MPQAVVASAILTGGAYAFGTIPAGMLVSEFFFKNLVISAAAGAIGNMLSDDGQAQAPVMTGRSVMFRSSVAPHQVIYGEAMVSGPIVYAASSGDDNRYLHMVIPLAGHEVEAIDEIYFNDEPATDFDDLHRAHVVSVYCGAAGGSLTLDGAPYSGGSFEALAAAISVSPLYLAEAEVINADFDIYRVVITGQNSGHRFVVGGALGANQKVLVNGEDWYRINRHLGSATQAADTDLVAEVAEWTTDHRLRGIAYIYVRLTWSPDIWPNGIPNIRARVRGKKVQGISGIEYSDNWALCVNDYLTSAEGFSVAASEVDAAELSNAISVSNESVEYQPGLFQPRYTINGAFTLDRSPLDVLADLLSAGAGTAVFQTGKWYLHPGAAQAAEATGLGIDDLRGPLRFRTHARRQGLFNAVRGTFINPDDFYQQTDFPMVTNAGFETEDGGQQLVKDISLPFTDDVYAAQRLATIHLIENRNDTVIEWPAKITGLRYHVGDVVPVTVPAMGWTNKLFRLIDFSLSGGGGPDLVLQAYDASTWTHDVGSVAAYVTPPVSSLPSPRQVQPVSTLRLYSGTEQLLQAKDGTVLSMMLADWRTQDAFALVDEVEYQKDGDATWITAGRTDAQQLLIGPVIDGEDYNVRVRSVNTLGVRSSWIQFGPHTVVGKTQLPPNPTGLAVTVLSDGLREFSVTATLPLDHAGYLFRARAGSHATWDALSVANGGINLHIGPVTQRPWQTGALPAGSYTIGVKLIDTTGNESATAYLDEYTLSANPAELVAAAGDTAEWDSVNNRPVDSDILNAALRHDADITVTVGSGGDYATISAAIAALTSRFPSAQPGGLIAEISLLSGFVLAEQLIFRGVNLGWIIITGVDASTQVVVDSGDVVTEPIWSGVTTSPLVFAGAGAISPVIAQKFVSGSGNGVVAGFAAKGGGSSLIVAAGAGYTNIPTSNIFNLAAVDGGLIVAKGTEFLDANGSGQSIARDGSTLVIDGATLGRIAAFRSFVSAESCNISDTAGLVSALSGSVVSVEDSTLTCTLVNPLTSGGFVIASSGSTIDLDGATIVNGAKLGRGIVCESSTVSANNVDFSAVTPNDGFQVTKGGIIQASGTTGTLSQTANTVTANGIIFK